MKYSIKSIDRIVIFKIKNRNVDSKISPQVKEQLLIISQPDIEALILDVSDVETIDSSGIGSFLLAERQLSDHGVPMVLVGVCDNIKKTMQILNLDQLFDFFDTSDEAIAAIEDARK